MWPHASDLANHQGIRLLAKGELASAKGQFDRALAECPREDKVRLSACLNNLACYYKEAQEPQQALLLIRQSLGLAKKLYLAAPHEQAYQFAYADALVNLGVMQSVVGRHRESLALCRKGMQILEQSKALGEHSNVLTISLYNQAVELMHLKDPVRAGLLLERVRRRCSGQEASLLPALVEYAQGRERTLSRTRREHSLSRDSRTCKFSSIATMDSRATRRPRRDVLMPRDNLQEINY
jgi:tetratricopeptide (TPR) repeat protein